MCTGSIPHVGYDSDGNGLEVLYLYTDWNIFDFVMYYIYGQSGPSLLIESTDSMIDCERATRLCGARSGSPQSEYGG